MSPRKSTLKHKHVREWGASGSVRLDPGAAGRGLSFSLLLSRGSSGSGVARLWERSAAAGAASATARGRLESELGYARPAFAGMGAATLYTGLSVAQGGVLRFRVGARLDLGTAFDLDFEADRGDRRGLCRRPRRRLPSQRPLGSPDRLPTLPPSIANPADRRPGEQTVVHSRGRCSIAPMPSMGSPRPGGGTDAAPAPLPAAPLAPLLRSSPGARASRSHCGPRARRFLRALFLGNAGGRSGI